MADEKWMKIPYFAKGKAENLDKALQGGKFDNLDKALFYFAIDTKQWVLVDVDKSIHVITGYNGQPTPGPGGDGGVKRVDVLPPILEGDLNTLYILGDTVYSFNGSSYVPTYKEAENEIGTLPPGTNVVEYVNDVREEAIQSANQYTDEQLQLHVLYD